MPLTQREMVVVSPAPLFGELAGSVTAVQFPRLLCRYILIKAESGNAGNVYIGTSGNVTVAGGDTDTTTGYELDAGQEMLIPLAVGHTENLWYICNNAGDDLTYLCWG